MAKPSPCLGEDHLSDPESSLYDYSQMEQAGFATVDFGTWPNQNRRSYFDNKRASTTAFGRSVVSEAIVPPPHAADMYSDLDPDNAPMEEVKDLYAVKIRKETRTKKKSRRNSDLDHTQQEVNLAMQAVNDMTAETMSKSVVKQVSGSYPGSSSGIGTMKREDFESSEVDGLPQTGVHFPVNPHDQELQESRDDEVADPLLRNHFVQEMKKENELLKTSVHRLSSELIKYQSKYRPLSSEEQSKLPSLAADGSMIKWHYLAPLLLAYDDQMKEKEEALERHLKEIQELKIRTKEVLRENERLHLQGGSNTGQLSTSDWRQFQEQARLVLEENQILIEKLNVQENKIKDLCSSHTQEVIRLMKSQAQLETEKQESETELEEQKCKFKDIKQKYDQLLLNSNNHITVQDHINIIADLKKSILEEKKQLEKEKETFTSKLKVSEDERRKNAMAAIELGAENKQLKAEIKALHKGFRKTQNKILILQKAIEQSENKELIIQNELANVIRIVEKTALERDTAFKVVKEQQQDCKETVNCMLGTNVAKGKLEERVKMYKLKASAKLQTLAEKLKEQDNAFNRQCQEYEREIRYLRLLVKEKEEIIRSLEGVKKEVEEDLEVMWQAASSENQHLKNVLRTSVSKLQERTSLKAVLEDEDELETLMCFSDRDV